MHSDDRSDDNNDSLDAAKKAITAAGYGWYVLGESVHRSNDGTVMYWLNAHSFVDSQGNRRQPYGWFTPEELEALVPWDDSKDGQR